MRAAAHCECARLGLRRRRGTASSAARQSLVPPHRPFLSHPRHFAERQLRSDRFGMSIGALVYLSLIPSLTELGRQDLAAAAVACSLLCTWPMVLARCRRDLYAARRDYLLLAQ